MTRPAACRKAFFLVALCFACSSPTSQPASEPLELWADSPHLVLSNPGEQPVYFMVFESELLTRADIFFCDSPQTCDSVAPGEQVRREYESIAGYDQPGDVATVFWWHFLSRGGVFRPDSIRTEQVTLR